MMIRPTIAVSTIALLALATGLGAATAPQGANGPSLEPTLSKQRLQSLRRVARRTVLYESRLREDPRYREKRDESSSFLMHMFEPASPTSRHPLADMGNPLAVLENTLPYKRATTTSERRSNRQPRYDYFGPQDYNREHAYPAVLTIRRRGGPRRSEWRTTWDTETHPGSFTLVVPDFVKHDDRTTPILSNQQELEAEFKRIDLTMGAFGDLQRKFRFDRRRRFLDCGPGTCGFGLRLATYFPTTFAGIILRDPVPIGNGFRLDSLAGVRLLIYYEPHNEHVSREIQRQLDAYQPGNVTLLSSTHTNRHALTEEWLRTTRRDLFPRRVVLAPDLPARTHRSHWLTVTTLEPTPFIRTDQPPLVIAEADYQNNRIIVQTRGVTAITLDLNDYLIDFDRTPMLIINGLPPRKLLLKRNVTLMIQTMFERFDETELYTARRTLRMPREAASMWVPALEQREGPTLAVDEDPSTPIAGARRSRSSRRQRPDPRPPFIDRNPPAGDERHRGTASPTPLRRAELPTELAARAVADETTEFGVESDDAGGGWFQFYWTLPDVTAWLGVLGVIILSIGFYLSRRHIQPHR